MGVFAIRGRGLAVLVVIAPQDNVISQPLGRNTPQIISGCGSCLGVERSLCSGEGISGEGRSRQKELP